MLLTFPASASIYTCHQHLQKSGLQSHLLSLVLQGLSPVQRFYMTNCKKDFFEKLTVSWMWFQSLTTSSRTPGLSSGKFANGRFFRNSSRVPCFPRSIFSTQLSLESTFTSASSISKDISPWHPSSQDREQHWTVQTIPSPSLTVARKESQVWLRICILQRFLGHCESIILPPLVVEYWWHLKLQWCIYFEI